MIKTTKNSTGEDEVAAMIRHLVDIDGHSTLDTPEYVGFCIIYNGKPFIVTVLEAKVTEL